MRLWAVCTLVALLWTTSAVAQVKDRVYAGATLGSNVVSADDIDTSSVIAAGGTIGVRLMPSLSVQFDLNRGSGELSRVYEGIGVSFAGPGANREEIERLGAYQRFERYWKPQVGWSAFVVWHNAEPRRVRVALFGGVSAIRFRERYLITTLRIPSGVDPNERSLQPSNEAFTRAHGGLTGGVMVPIAVANRISIAPEVKYTYGSVGDEIYNVFATGVRMLWRF